jgi:membrane protein implicated in regulation of membrane protease activity
LRGCKAACSSDVVLTVFLIASFLVPWPWNLAVIALGAAGEVGEVVWGRRLARRKADTGTAAMVGQTVEVVQTCRPDGRVRLGRELWNAVCDDGADAGDTVAIAAVNGLTLQVAPLAAPHRRSSQRGDAVGARRDEP